MMIKTVHYYLIKNVHLYLVIYNIESVNKKGKKVLDKLSKTGYDVSRISAYAKQSIELGNYDEAHTEYRVKKIYEGE